MRIQLIHTLLLSSLFALGCNGQKTEKTAETQAPAAEQNAPAGDTKANNDAETAETPKADVQAAAVPLVPGSNTAPAGQVCEDADGCACGETTCPMNAVCTDGVCKCGDTVVQPEYTGYICMEIAKGVYDLGCTESDGCPCGKIKVYSNMGCSGKWGTCAGIPVPGRGLSCKHKPHNGKMYSLNCFKDECDCFGGIIHKNEICEPPECVNGHALTPQGCVCGNGLIDNGQHDYKCIPGKDDKRISVCTNPEGCQCSQELFCPTGSVCYHYKCVDRQTMKPLPAEGYKLVNGLPRCDADECVCHKTKCKNGKFCLNGICYSDPYFRKIDGKVLYYYIFSDDPAADAGAKEQYRDDVWSLLVIDETTPICSKFGSIRVKGSSDDICQKEETKNMTVAQAMKQCGTAPVPEKVASMFCTLDVEDGALVFSGWEA